MGWVQVKVLFEGLSETYLFCYNLFLQLYTEKEIKDIKIVILCYLFEKQHNHIFIHNRLWNLVVLRMRMRSSTETMKKITQELKAGFGYLCV